MVVQSTSYLYSTTGLQRVFRSRLAHTRTRRKPTMASSQVMIDEKTRLQNSSVARIVAASGAGTLTDPDARDRA